MGTTAADPDRCLRRDAAANRGRILDAAREAFARDGIDVSLIEIARRAGVGNATLHRNFTKESLVQALYEEWRAKRHAASLRALEDPDPWNGLRAFMVDTLEDASRNRTLIDVFMIRMHCDATVGNPVAELVRSVLDVLGDRPHDRHHRTRRARSAASSGRDRARGTAGATRSAGAARRRGHPAAARPPDRRVGAGDADPSPLLTASCPHIRSTSRPQIPHGAARSGRRRPARPFRSRTPPAAARRAAPA